MNSAPITIDADALVIYYLQIEQVAENLHLLYSLPGDVTCLSKRKVNFYHACPSIQEYMLIATKYQAVEVQRRAGDEWTLHLFGPGDEIELMSTGVRFSLATLYRGTAVPEPPNDQD